LPAPPVRTSKKYSFMVFCRRFSVISASVSAELVQ